MELGKSLGKASLSVLSSEKVMEDASLHFKKDVAAFNNCHGL